jgi:ADP-heptose:LPS heptosyltransferase
VGERLKTRVAVTARALLRGARRKHGAGGPIERILVAHNLLLGDLLMLTPLLARLRANHPQAEITLLAAPAYVPLYATRPYGVRALPFRPAQSQTTRALLEEPPFDLAFVIGDNRYGWLAAAMGARRIIAHAGDRPWTKSVFIDEFRPYASSPETWGEMVADLADGEPSAPYARGNWALPNAAPFEVPAGRYAVLHVGASTPLKYWLPQRWNALAQALHAQGFGIVWSAGRGEQALVEACDPQRRFRSCAGALDLVQLWHLLDGAALLVVPDTGVAHLGRVAWTPTVSLFGPGSAQLCARGRFWRNTPWVAVSIADFPCRDQRILFRREVPWVRRCGRSIAECAEPLCMHAIGVDAVLEAISELLHTSG